MKKLSGLLILALAGTLGSASPLGAQQVGSQFRWYIGGQAGVTVFETPAQERGGIFTAGGNVLVTARRTALMLSVEEGIGDNELTSYVDASAPGGVRQVSFNDIRKYSFILMVYPLKSSAQPFVGAGFGILHVHNPFPMGTFASPAEQANARATARDLGSHGFATFAAGIQFQVGRVGAFGMYQITTSPSSGRLLEGPTHALMGGVRLSLGGSKESITGGGY